MSEIGKYEKETLQQYMNRMVSRRTVPAEISEEAKTKLDEYWKSLEKRESNTTRFTARELVEYMKRRSKATGKDFIIDEFNRDYIAKLCLFFSGKYEKGLQVRGNYGTGKTYPLYLISGLPQTFKTANMVNCKEIKRLVSMDGMDADLIQRLLSKFMDLETMVLDEVSEDWKVNFMGTVLNPVELILIHRYDLFQRYGTSTFITTNLDAQALENNYGGRVRSRLREMCEDVNVIGNDRRK